MHYYDSFNFTGLNCTVDVLHDSILSNMEHWCMSGVTVVILSRKNFRSKNPPDRVWVCA